MNDALMIAYKVSLVIFMAGSLLDMGLRLNVQDALRGLRCIPFVAHTLVWCFVFCPALAYVLTLVIPLEQPYAVGLLLLGMAPCAPFAPIFVTKAKGDLGYTAALMVLTAVGTAVFMPVALPLMVKGLSTTAWAIAKPLLVVVILPMAAGVIARSKSPAMADRINPVVKKATGLFALMWCILALVLYGKSLLGVAGTFAVGTQLIFFCAIFACTYLLSFGLPREQKIVLSVGATTRNLGACLAPLLAVPDMDARASLMILLGLPMMIVGVLLGMKFLVPNATPSDAH
jgi:bile acid:Na+ symporter, BASS family